MRSLFLSFALLMVLGGEGVAQEQAAPQQNPFDLSAAKQALGDQLPTVASVASAERLAQELFAAGDCKAAVDALDRYARDANTLANLISRGLQPFYGASYDERQSFRAVNRLVPLERLANEYKTKRNRAMVMQAECLGKLGEPQKAATIYYQALGLIDIDDTEWWERARSGLYMLVQLAEAK